MKQELFITLQINTALVIASSYILTSSLLVICNNVIKIIISERKRIILTAQ